MNMSYDYILEKTKCDGCNTALKYDSGYMPHFAYGIIRFKDEKRDIVLCPTCLDRWRNFSEDKNLQNTLKVMKLKWENEELKKENKKLK